jgi:hypothetical protein
VTPLGHSARFAHAAACPRGSAPFVSIALHCRKASARRRSSDAEQENRLLFAPFAHDPAVSNHFLSPQLCRSLSCCCGAGVACASVLSCEWSPPYDVVEGSQ